MIDKINKFEFENRKLNINFNLMMNNEVDDEILKILIELHKYKFPVNQFKEIKYILSKKKQMMFGTPNISKLFEDKAIISISYPGMFINNDEHNYKLNSLKDFDKEDFKETSLHESVHAYHIIFGKHSKKILKNLLELDKFKDKKNHKKHIINELNRFPKQCLFEGYAQIICHLNKYYSLNKEDSDKQYENMIASANELTESINKFKTLGIKKEIIELLLRKCYYGIGPQLFYFIIYFNKREFEEFKDYTVEQLFKEFEEILETNNLEIPISLNSGKGIFDIEKFKEVVENGV
ncbi:MAG: hypothetical protein ACOCXG_03870 [Nanoarchaeota archaeon]